MGGMMNCPVCERKSATVTITYHHDNGREYNRVRLNRGVGVAHLRVVEFVRSHAPENARVGDYGVLIDEYNGVTHYPVTLDVPRLRAIQ
jgi:hypothetical protein